MESSSAFWSMLSGTQVLVQKDLLCLLCIICQFCVDIMDIFRGLKWELFLFHAFLLIFIFSSIVKWLDTILQQSLYFRYHFSPSHILQYIHKSWFYLKFIFKKLHLSSFCTWKYTHIAGIIMFAGSVLKWEHASPGDNVSQHLVCSLVLCCGFLLHLLSLFLLCSQTDSECCSYMGLDTRKCSTNGSVEWILKK